MIFLGPEGMLYKVFPKNIEEIINRVEGIKDSCVVSKEKNGKLEALAYVIADRLDIDKEKIEKQIVAGCQKNMPDYMIPKTIMWMDSFPLTVAGKVDFKKLEELAKYS